ncbi:MAG: metallophosphoesterase [Clostridiales bacterium]|nr:metallophosphoesterase [Clostridiales bacterium]
MALYTIADLHLPLGKNKPMDIFGAAWENYVERLRENWQRRIKPEDLVVLPGDFSWATYLEEALEDFRFLNSLNGRKILLKGNHDYWWTTKNKLNSFVKENGFCDIEFMHNGCMRYGDIALCGTRGWKNPSWDSFNEQDRKIFDREVIRLELSLKEAAGAEEIYVFVHYPPMAPSGEKNEFTRLMEAYPVTKCFYGHLHGASHRFAVNGIADGIEYRLVSADYLKFDPYEITGD